MVGFIEIVPGKGIKYLNLNISRFFQFFGSNIKVTDIHQAFEINQEMKDGADWQTAADETLFHPSDHNGEMIYSLIKSRELSNTSRVWIMAVITQPPLDDGDQAHMSVVRSHPLLAPVMHGNWGH